MVEEIAPNSFTDEMARQNFDKASGTERSKPTIAKGFVKPNGIRGKIKPRLTQPFGPEGSAAAALMNKTIEEMVFRLPYFTTRSIKGTDYAGVVESSRA